MSRSRLGRRVVLAVGRRAAACWGQASPAVAGWVQLVALDTSAGLQARDCSDERGTAPYLLALSPVPYTHERGTAFRPTNPYRWVSMTGRARLRYTPPTAWSNAMAALTPGELNQLWQESLRQPPHRTIQ